MLEAHDGSYVDLVKYFSNRSCDRFAPSSVKTTDFAFVAGSPGRVFSPWLTDGFLNRARSILILPFALPPVIRDKNRMR